MYDEHLVAFADQNGRYELTGEVVDCIIPWMKVEAEGFQVLPDWRPFMGNEGVTIRCEYRPPQVTDIELTPLEP
jgi:hypothetical protein